MRSEEESYAEQQTFNFRFVNCDAIVEVHPLTWNQEGVLRENLFAESGPAFNVNYTREIKREKAAVDNIDKVPLTAEERPLRIFRELNGRFPDAKWVGRAICVPSLGIWVRPEWREENVAGSEGEELSFVRRVVREAQ